MFTLYYFTFFYIYNKQKKIKKFIYLKFHFVTGNYVLVQQVFEKEITDGHKMNRFKILQKLYTQNSRRESMEHFS